MLYLVIQLFLLCYQAEEAARLRLELEQKQNGCDHQNVAEALGELAYVLRAQGRFEDAEQVIWVRARHALKEKVI